MSGYLPLIGFRLDLLLKSLMGSEDNKEMLYSLDEA